MFDRRDKTGSVTDNDNQQATLGVHVNWKSHQSQNSQASEDKEEFINLIKAADVEIAELVVTIRQSPDPKYFIGKGKIEELQDHVQQHQASLVIFNHDLSPIQERNLEQALHCRVLDRSGLILDIFAQRARSREGQLQVELAQLEHLSTRLVRGWTHLERQRGGIGLRGPGETQLETDRRLIQSRIKTIERRLAKVQKQRAQSRRSRKRAEIPTISLVGYTNAGKSTLFNALTESKVGTANQLFATLDPTVRRIDVPLLGPVVLSDTVGFIRHLPHQLIEAFKATLEETRQADLLLHVVDIANPEYEKQMEQVNKTLQQIGIDDTPVLCVYNKIDKLEYEQSPRIDWNKSNQAERVWLSAYKELGLDLLIESLRSHLSHELVNCCVKLSPNEGDIRSKLYELDVVNRENITDEGEFLLEIEIQRHHYHQLFKQDNDSRQSW